MTKKVCVIGAGLAGGMLAARLAERGHDVTLLEQGESPAPLIPDNESWEGADLKAVFTRGQGIGGSSNFWHGGLIVLDAADIEGTAPGESAPKWPITYRELCDYYRSALSIMTNGSVSLEDLLADDLRADGFEVDRSMFRLKPMFFPHAPFSTAGIVGAAAREHGLKVVTGFSVERLCFAERTRVVGVEGVQQGQSTRTTISADVFIVCAGGIGSPKILLESALANPLLQDLPVGKSLIDHPTGFTFKAKLRKRRNLKQLFGDAAHRPGGMRRRLGMVLRGDQLDIAAGRNHVLYLRPAFTLRDPQQFNELKARLVAHRGQGIAIVDFFRLLLHPDLFAEALNFRFGLFTSVRYVAGFVFAEQLSVPENAIRIDERDHFSVRWEISTEDRDSLREFLTAFVKRHDDIFEEVVFFPELLGSGAHHSGGCRMAADRAHGVVGADLRVFGMDNLFVADGSVLGYSGHANTGLTIAALGLKCADEVMAVL